MEITFTNPLYLFLLFALPMLILTHFFSMRYTKTRAIQFANFEALSRAMSGKKLSKSPISKHLGLLFVRFLTLTALILAAAGPVLWYSSLKSDINYVLALDASGSMLAEDFPPNRLASAKSSAEIFAGQFLGKVKIGVVSFAGISYTESRLSDNFQEVQDAITGIEIKPTHGTAVGDALKTSANILLAEEKPGVIILITDGRENVASQSEFNKIIQYLQEKHVTANTIGIGTAEGGKIPGIDIISSIDEDKLKEIASSTEGQYFRADSEESLKNSFDSILTGSSAQVPFDLRFILVLFAIVMLFNEWGLVSTKFRTVP